MSVGTQAIYYRLERIEPRAPKPGDRGIEIANASVGSCGLCGQIICGMGGSPDMVCLPCGDAMQRVLLKTCVIRTDEP
jgi:hypothetical protein